MTTPAEELREFSEAIAFDYPETARRLLELAAALDSQARKVERLRAALVTLNTKAYSRSLASDSDNGLRHWEVEQIVTDALAPQVEHE